MIKAKKDKWKSSFTLPFIFKEQVIELWVKKIKHTAEGEGWGVEGMARVLSCRLPLLPLGE